MLILKIMSSEDMPDSSPDKQFKLIADVRSVEFFTDKATDYEKTLLGYKSQGRRRFCTIKMPDGKIEDWVRYLPDSSCGYLKDGGVITESWYQAYPGGDNWPSRKEWLTGDFTKSHDDLTVSFARVTRADKHQEVHLLTGNCYVLNDRGKTIESFWVRRTPAGELISEQ